MGLEQIVNNVAEVTKEAKEAHVKELGRNSDIPQSVMSIRGETPNIIFLTAGDSENMLNLAQAIVRGMGVDCFAMASESYYSDVPNNPITELPWGPGEMQRAVEAYDGLARGWVREVILVVAYTRDGGHYTLALPYSVDDEGVVQWGEEKRKTNRADESEMVDAGEEVAGHVWDVVQDLFARPTVQDEMLRRLGPENVKAMTESMPVWEREVRQDFQVVRMVIEQGMAQAFLVEETGDEERDNYMRERLADLDNLATVIDPDDKEKVAQFMERAAKSAE